MTEGARSALHSLRQRTRKLLVPVLRRVMPTRLPMRGPFGSYEEALAEATGYDSPLVTQQVEEATTDVLNGRAAYERDGTAFPERPELAIHAALRQVVKPRSTIADFGGGLGGLYLNAPELFAEGCRCLVIEQASMVAAGHRLKAAHGLGIEFFEGSDLSAVPQVDVLVLSGVLQYLPAPWHLLDGLLSQLQPAAVIIDRTATRRRASRWYLQTNPGVYRQPVSYPVQVLERRRLLAAFHGYRLVRNWYNAFDPGRPEHIGMLLVKVDAAGARG